MKIQSHSRLHRSGTSQWRLDIQGMRGMTMLVIVLFHAGLPIPGGFVALDAFFVISGFVISGMLAREYSTHSSISLRQFYLRRFKRLTPALITMLIIISLLSSLIISPISTQTVTAWTALGATFLIANAVVQQTSGGYFDLGAELNPLLHTWSLSLEEQFYFIFPILLILGFFLASRLVSSTFLTVLPLSVIGGLSLLLALVPVEHLPPFARSEAFIGYYSPAARVWEFCAGALLFFGTQGLRKLSSGLGLTSAVTGLFLFFLPMWVISESVRYPGPWTLMPVVGTLLLIFAGFSSENPVSKFLGSPPMTWVGDRSYSWYLWHWPMIVFSVTLFPSLPFIAVLGGALSLLPALLSYRWIEKPLRRKDMTNPQIIRLTAMLLTASTLAASGLLWVSKNHFGNQTLAAAQEQVEADHTAKENSCHVYQTPKLQDYGQCWLSSGKGRPLMLVGDSNADHFSDGLKVAATALDRPLFALSISSCPFLPATETSLPEDSSERCQTYYNQTMQWLKKQPAGTVVMATTGRGGADQDEANAYRNGRLNSIQQLKALGHSVVLLQPIPFIPQNYSDGKPWDPRGCSIASLVVDRCGINWPLTSSSEQQQLIWNANEDLALQEAVHVLDLSDELCTSGFCDTNRGDSWVYRDFNHLTVGASEGLSSEFEDFLRAR